MYFYFYYSIKINLAYTSKFILNNQPGEYVDMVKAGIIDPLKVIRTALVDAAR